MSLAQDLEKTTIRLRVLLHRERKEQLQKGPELLDELHDIIERVRHFERVATIDMQTIEIKKG